MSEARTLRIVLVALACVCMLAVLLILVNRNLQREDPISRTRYTGMAEYSTRRDYRR